MACVNKNTHAAVSEIELTKLLEWAKADGLAASITDQIFRANTAREIIVASEFDQNLLELVCRRADQSISCFAPGVRAQLLVADYSEHIVYCSNLSATIFRSSHTGKMLSG